MKKLITAMLALCIALIPLCSCRGGTEKIEPQSVTYYNFFDTVSVIYSYKGDSREEFAENCTRVYGVLERYHRLFDIYYEYSGINNIRTINKNAGIAPVKVDEDLIDFLLYAKGVYTLTDGRTNIAMGSVLRLWHDCREEALEDPDSARIPSEAELAEAAMHTDIDKLVIDVSAGTVYLADSEMSLDVGAIGKGYAAERAAEALDSDLYVLDIGGNIRMLGYKTGSTGWTVGITDPDRTSGRAYICELEAADTSLVTSGDYERYYTVGGVNYHHVIDPETNMPSEYFASVSVLTDDSGFADALSTALFCMSYEDGLALIERLESSGKGEIEAIWVTRDGVLLKTDGISVRQ